MDKKYISCLVNDKVGVCAISLVLDKRHVLFVEQKIQVEDPILRVRRKLTLSVRCF